MKDPDLTALSDYLIKRVAVISATPSGWIVRTPTQVVCQILSLPEIREIIAMAAAYNGRFLVSDRSAEVEALLADWHDQEIPA